MIFNESASGSFVKDGARYTLTLEATDVRGSLAAEIEAQGYTYSPQPPVIPRTAQAWIEQQGYSALMAVALSDMERKAAVAGVTSPKLVAVRAWFDGILMAYAADPSPRSDWPAAPCTFAEVAAEVAV